MQPFLQKFPKGSKVEIEILLIQAEFLSHPLNFLRLSHQGHTHPFDLMVAERSCFDSPDRLTFHKFVKEFHQCKDQLTQSVLGLIPVET